MQDLLRKFIGSFQKAITEEMNATRQRMETFKVLLADARALDITVEDPNSKLFFYASM